MKIIMHDGSIEEHSFDEEIGAGALRHTASHVLAQAVKRLFPETSLDIFYATCYPSYITYS